MLSIFLRTIAVKAPTARASAIRLASFTVRDALSVSDETGTLLNRFAKHLAMECSATGDSLVQTKIRYPDYFPVTDVKHFYNELEKTSVEQLPYLIIFLSTYRPNAEPMKYVQILNNLDKYAVQHLPSMDLNTTLRTLYALLFLIPNWLTRTDFYKAAMRRAIDKQWLEECSANKDQFVQLCFYLGLAKQYEFGTGKEKYLENLLLKSLQQHLDSLSSMDLVLVASAAYKTSTVIPFAQYNERLEQELLKLELQPGQDAIVVTLLKAMRLQRHQSANVCEYISKNICSKPVLLSQLQAVGLSHVFAYFSENLWNEQASIAALAEEFINRLQSATRKFETPHSKLLRPKDVTMFLWCCAQLNISLTQPQLQLIETVLLEQLRQGLFVQFADQLVDCSLSLWILGYKSKHLLQAAINLKESQPPKLKKQPKVDSRLIVLQSAAAIEEPSWIVPPDTPYDFESEVPSYLTKSRADLVKYLKSLKTEQGVVSAKFVCPIVGINLPSLMVELAEASAPVFVDLLSEQQTLKFNNEPIGLVKLKLRLLQALGHKTVLLHSKDIADNYTSLSSHISHLDLANTSDKLNKRKSQQTI